jgi:uncharacterized integral membrane protein
MTEVPGHPGDDAARARRRRRLLRTGGIAVVGVLVLIFVLDNAQSVQVRFWGVHSHPRLIWLIVACLLIGGVVGYLIGRPGRRRRKDRDARGKR